MEKKHRFIKRDDLMNIIKSLEFKQNYSITVRNDKEHFFCIKQWSECIEHNVFCCFATKINESFTWRNISLDDIQMISFYHPDEGYTSCHLI